MESLQFNLSDNPVSAPLIGAAVPLADKSWFRTGGTAEWYSEPRTAQEFQQAIIWALQYRLPVTLIGEGANILISDAGIPGLTIRPALRIITHQDQDDAHALVTAQSGVSFPQLITYCLTQNLIGLEEFSGIPGTVGGSLFINIHYFEWLLSNFLVCATILNRTTGEQREVDHAWFNFGYNYSTLHAGTDYLIDATFKVRKANSHEIAYAQGRRAEIIRHRQQRYPRERTCGSFFRNFYEHEVTAISNNKKMIYVAYYLDKIGAKGTLQVGGARISYQHANMIVTDPTATSNDIITLARQMQELVYTHFSITPQPECRLLGFSDYPLHLTLSDRIHLS